MAAFTAATVAVILKLLQLTVMAQYVDITDCLLGITGVLLELDWRHFLMPGFELRRVGVGALLCAREVLILVPAVCICLLVYF